VGVAENVAEVIAPDDAMYAGDARHYFETGRQALELIQQALDYEPTTILDMPCGHGRVLRWLRAAYPTARITACDIDRAGVDFCVATFGALPVYGSDDLEQVDLDGVFDLIWVGSLFTHLDAHRWRAFLRFFESRLQPAGRLVFTTHGRHVAEHMRSWDGDNAALFVPFDRDGFGYTGRPGRPHFGGSLSTPEWVRRFVESETRLSVLDITERGWDDFQDVAVCALRGSHPARR
jgi:SAM-dependent methyltransferase